MEDDLVDIAENLFDQLEHHIDRIKSRIAEIDLTLDATAKKKKKGGVNRAALLKERKSLVGELRTHNMSLTTTKKTVTMKGTRWDKSNVMKKKKLDV